ncbi:MAG: glycosyltransferase family 2 protein [Alphaproteobacteria bacterium]|nr:glycosyltransferase family 2 protein [Alphaproteobacteria bacterium]
MLAFNPEAAPSLSCYIRTQNEETRIGAAVIAALAVAREVVVIDSGSTDGTVAVAEAAGARVVEQPWLGGGHQKRVGEDACRHDWLLDLDADEIVSGELAQEIQALFAGGAPDADIFQLPLVTVDPSGRIWRRARASHRAKLYDRRKIRMPAHGAWDQFRIPAGLRVRRLNGALLHHAFDDIGHLSRKQTSAMIRRVRYLNDGWRAATVLRVLFGLPVFFLRNYLLRGQWREGRYGFLFALSTAYNHWLRYALLYERQRARDDEDGGC